MRKFVFVLILSPVLLCACSLGQLREAATEPHPATGKTPTESVTSALPSLIANPLDLNAWANIIEATIVLGAAGFGYKEWRKFRRGTIAPK